MDEERDDRDDRDHRRRERVDEGGEREDRDQPDEVDRVRDAGGFGRQHQPFISLTSSTSTVGRLRYSARTIARPTATSAAAMTKTKTTKTLPRSSIRPRRRDRKSTR